MKTFFISFILFNQTFLVCNSFSQDVFSDLKKAEEYDPASSPASTNIEKIIVKSRNRRILILTNDEKSATQGDFVTLFSGELKLARALVAKVGQRKIALKIITTFNNQFDSLSNRGQEITIVRGDAQGVGLGFSKKEEEFFTKIDGLDDQPSDKKMIEKNIITLGVGVIKGIDANKKTNYYIHYLLSYSYNMMNDFWFEGTYGYSAFNQFPIKDILTNFHSLNAKIKYNFHLPAYMYFMPYVGVQFNNAQATEDISLSDVQKENLQSLNEVNFIGGITFHKRLVPGWMVSINLGVDSLHGGLSIAF